MPDRNPDPYRDAGTISHQIAIVIARLQPSIGPAFHNLHRQADTHDSYPTATLTDGTPTGGRATRVEAAVLHRLGDDTHPGPTTIAWNLLDYLITIRDAANHALRITEANRHDQLTDGEKQRLYCIHDTPTRCTDYATIAGYCDRHHLQRQAEQRAIWANERRQRRYRVQRGT